jgi:hypothetical protein
MSLLTKGLLPVTAPLLLNPLMARMAEKLLAVERATVEK